MSPERTKLIVIGQQQRCGGSLMVRLFDGQGRIFVHPHENYSGRPYKYYLPDFDVEAQPQVIWASICEPNMEIISGSHVVEGRYRLDYDFVKHRRLFLDAFPPTRGYQEIFYHYLDTMAQAINAYGHTEALEGYLYFAPRQALYAEEILRAFTGSHVVQIVRNPLGFYNSVKSHNRFYDILSAKFIWRLFYFNALFHAGRKTANFHPVIFEDLLAEPENNLRGLCAGLGIDYNDKMLTPTFGGKEWSGDSHFQKWKGIDRKAVNHYQKYLSEEEKGFLAEDMSLYNALKESWTCGGIKQLPDLKEVGRGLEIFDKFIGLYKKEKPVNSKGYVFSGDAEQLYFALAGNMAYVPRAYFVLTGGEEEALLADTGEIMDRRCGSSKEMEASSDEISFMKRELLARFLISVVNVKGIGRAIAAASSVPALRVRETVDEMLEIWNKDSRGINLKMLIFLLLWAVKSLLPGLLTKVLSCGLRNIWRRSVNAGKI